MFNFFCKKQTFFICEQCGKKSERFVKKNEKIYCSYECGVKYCRQNIEQYRIYDRLSYVGCNINNSNKTNLFWCSNHYCNNDFLEKDIIYTFEGPVCSESCKLFVDKYIVYGKSKSK